MTITDKQTKEEQILNRGRANFKQRKSRFRIKRAVRRHRAAERKLTSDEQFEQGTCRQISEKYQTKEQTTSSQSSSP